ncbi:MAG: hypothetical protein P1V97_21265, partial [Planctomycetota bacterium]|nr:hypothetical protein [Planctomycetota bacterium]
MNYAKRIQARLENLDLDSVDERKARQKSIRDIRHELRELRGRIPTWDRIVFFSDTPDEAREAVLEQQLNDEQEALNKFYKTMEGRLQSICEDFPPLAIA